MIAKYGAGFILLLKIAAALEASPDGTCGGVQQYTCDGAEVENPCCSQYGWCGSSDDHCGVGCQSEFGTCNETSTLPTDSFPILEATVDLTTTLDPTEAIETAVPSASVPSTLVVKISTSSAAASTSTGKPLPSSTGANAQSCTCSNTITSNPSCPSADGACYTVNGKTFSLSCGGLADGEVIGKPPIISLATCISTCSMISNCVAVSFFKDGTPECSLLSKYTGPSASSEGQLQSVARLQDASCK